MMKLIGKLKMYPVNIFFPPVHDNEIYQLEEELGYRLPASLRLYLSFSDGSCLFESEEILGVRAHEPYTSSILGVLRANNLPGSLLPFHYNGIEYTCFRLWTPKQPIVKFSDSRISETELASVEDFIYRDILALFSENYKMDH